MSKNLIWKLLRKHVSMAQLAGFFVANLIGMTVVLLAFQFYRDVLPVFTSEDSFLKSDYLIVSKKIGTAQMLSQRELSFSEAEVEDLAQRRFLEKVGTFVSADYKIDATMSIGGERVFTSELSLESIPDDFVDIDRSVWHYDDTSRVVPMLLPSSYLAMYNFGFARSRSLPKLSEGVAGMIRFDIVAHGNGESGRYVGQVIGFSNRMSTIIVPQAFVEETNARFSAGEKQKPTRLVIATGDLGDGSITQYLDEHGYDIENDRLQAEKSAFLLRLIVSAVILIGLVISLLSSYILMLSIYLLVQKNTDKLQTLQLIGYSARQTARPYQHMAFWVNIVVLAASVVVVLLLRNAYLPVVRMLFPNLSSVSLLPTVLLGLLLLVLATAVNTVAVGSKVGRLWKNSE